VAAAQSGTIGFSGCVSQLPGGGCAALPAGSLVGTAGIAVSPDGRSVYATSYGGDTISAFSRTGKGRLSFQQCIADAGAGGCEAPPGEPLRGAGGIAVSPNGGDVYVAAGLSHSISVLSRSPDGRLGFTGCV
jgi:DNA-binding beta-propeller fold protein YncE